MPPKTKSTRSAKKVQPFQSGNDAGNKRTASFEDVTFSDVNSDSEADEDDESLEIAIQAAQGLICSKTLKNYQQYISQLNRLSVAWGLGEISQPPYSFKLITAFFDHLSKCEVPWHGHPGRKKNLSPATIRIARNAINNEYRSSQVPVQEQIDVFMSNFCKSYELKVGREKMAGNYPVQCGRVALNQSAFKMLTKKLFEIGGPGCWDTQIACWPQWLLAGSSLSRGERVVRGDVEHLGSREDMLEIEFPTTKSDQVGLYTYPKRIASNCSEPMFDCFLALGVAFFCRNSETGTSLWPRGKSDGSISVLRVNLQKVLDKLDVHEKTILGCDPWLVGIHSVKKYGCTLLYDNENTVQAAIEKRCDHKATMGTASTHVYVGDLAHQDAFNARILAGFQVGDEKFCDKPAHFANIPRETEALIPWSKIICGYDSFPARCKAVMPFLLAAVIKHENWLREKLRHHGGHPILFSPLFTTYKDVMKHLRPYLRSGSDESDLTVTGITLAHKSFRELTALREQVNTIETLLRKLTLLPAAAITERAIQVRSEDSTDKILAAIASLRVFGRNDESITLTAPLTAVWSIGHFPKDWRMPSLQVDALWRAWFVATPSSPALGSVCTKMFPSVGKDRLSDIRTKARYSVVMRCVQGQLSTPAVLRNVDDAWNKSWEQFYNICVQEGHVPPSATTGAGSLYNWLSTRASLQHSLTSESRAAVDVEAACPSGTSTRSNGNGDFFAAQQHLAASPSAPAFVAAAPSAAESVAEEEEEARSLWFFPATAEDAIEGCPFVVTQDKLVMCRICKMGVLGTGALMSRHIRDQHQQRAHFLTVPDHLEGILTLEELRDIYDSPTSTTPRAPFDMFPISTGCMCSSCGWCTFSEVCIRQHLKPGSDCRKSKKIVEDYQKVPTQKPFRATGFLNGRKISFQRIFNVIAT